MQCGYKRLENDVKHHLKQNEKRNEKRGSISYAARTAQCNPAQPKHSNRPVCPVTLFGESGPCDLPLGRIIP